MTFDEWWDAIHGDLFIHSEIRRDAAEAGWRACQEQNTAPLEGSSVRLLINELRDVARKYGKTEQLRDRIAEVIIKARETYELGNGIECSQRLY